jgi:hypothetical protein
MRSSSVVAATLLALGLFGSLQSCSAGGTSGEPSSVLDNGSNQAPVLPGRPGQSGGTPTDPGGGFMVDDNTLIDANGRPINVGSELACDGIDENDNGITDDVDKGRDGLCDCLHIGFFGLLASDAGNATGAFESWLEARSDVPVKHIAARDTLTPELLKDLQVLVVGNLRERGNSGFSAAELDAFRQWIEVDGGGVMTLAGYSANQNDIVPTVALLQPTGLSYNYQNPGGPGVLLMGAPPMIANDFLAAGHPSLEGISALGVYAAYPVVGDGTVLVRESGFDLAMAKELGAGHVMAFSDEWITQDLLWGAQLTLQQTPCQQQCNQCKNQCGDCDRQCADCQRQPCQGGQQVPDGGTCVRGCDQGCNNCSNQCDTCEQACTTCTAAEGNRTLDIPRFWLNTLRWLTPANECQVPVPPTIVY